MTAIAEQPIYEIHNGGGRRERTVTCSPTAFLDPDTLIDGACSIWGTPAFEVSRLSGFCRVSGSPLLVDCLLNGRISVSDSAQLYTCKIVTDQRIVGNEFQWSEVEVRDSARLFQSEIDIPPICRVGIGGSTRFNEVKIRGNCHIEGGTFENCEIADGTWAVAGDWIGRAPRVVKTGAFFDVTESHIPGEVFIGCTSKPLALWLRSGKIFAEQYGITPEEFEIYSGIVKSWQIA